MGVWIHDLQTVKDNVFMLSILVQDLHTAKKGLSTHSANLKSHY
jgi:hypothetical protein